MTDPERLQHALDLAYRFLGHRDRTVAEVRERLAAERVEPDVVDEAIEELRHLGYLDDARYAQRFADDRRTIDAWGAERIERRLLAVGVDPELIAAALGDQGAGEELEAALAVLRRRFAQPPSRDRERDRALGLLVRKGYELDVAYDAVRAFERDAA
ncbi:MAG TPA: RecX family transcriptional regulator [Solirubrobacteraceae bacterium]|nr:RecX family transcriptional regulator [Solirubrobacteraceae bacterium]